MLLPERRGLLLSIVAAMSQAVAIPVCCKIRLLGTEEQTVAQPYATEAATLCDGGCNPMRRRLQPYTRQPAP
jgi:tRNA-dihydrouridine synthase